MPSGQPSSSGEAETAAAASGGSPDTEASKDSLAAPMESATNAEPDYVDEGPEETALSSPPQVQLPEAIVSAPSDAFLPESPAADGPAIHQPPAASPEEHQEEFPGRSDIWSEKMQFAVVEDDTEMDSTWAEERIEAQTSAAPASLLGNDRRLSAPPVRPAADSGGASHVAKARPPSAMPILQAPAPGISPNKEDSAATSGPAPEGEKPESSEKGLDIKAETAPEARASVIQTEEAPESAAVVRQEASLESSSPRTAIPVHQPQPPAASLSQKNKGKAAQKAVKVEDFMPSSGVSFPQTGMSSASKAKPGSVPVPTGLPTQPKGSPGVSVAPRPPRAPNSQSQHHPGSEIEDKESARRLAKMHAQAVRKSLKRIDIEETAASTSNAASGDASGEESTSLPPPPKAPARPTSAVG